MWAIPASLAFHLFASFYNLSDVVFTIEGITLSFLVWKYSIYKAINQCIKIIK